MCFVFRVPCVTLLSGQFKSLLNPHSCLCAGLARCPVYSSRTVLAKITYRPIALRNVVFFHVGQQCAELLPMPQAHTAKNFDAFRVRVMISLYYPQRDVTVLYSSGRTCSRYSSTVPVIRILRFCGYEKRFHKYDLPVSSNFTDPATT